MRTKCERCKAEKECIYFGSPADVDADRPQNGEWLCEECAPLRAVELDNAIARFKKILGG